MCLINSELLKANPNLLPCRIADATINFLHEVEMLLPPNPVEIELRKSSDNDFPGEMMFDYDCPWDEPRICYKEGALDDEGLFHELCHIQLICGKGFPVLYARGGYPIDLPDHLVSMLDGQIQHYLIFPKLIENGYNPYETEEKAFAMLLNDFGLKYSELTSNWKALWHIVLYSRVQIECLNRELKQKYDDKYEEYGLMNEKKGGIELAKIMRQHAIDDKILYWKGLEEVVRFLEMEKIIEIETLRP